MRISALLLIVFLAITTSCTGPQRAPSSVVSEEDKADQIQELDLQLSELSNTDWKRSQEIFQTGKNNEVFKPRSHHIRRELQKERQKQIDKLASKLNLRDWSGLGPWLTTDSHPPLFEKEEVLRITDLDQFKTDSQTGTFPLEHMFFKKYSLRLENDLPLQEDLSHSENISPEQKYLKARLECDGDFLFPGSWLFGGRRKGKVYEFNWYNSKINGQQIRLEFTSKVARCQLYFRDPEKSETWTHSIQLAEIGTLTPEWSKLTNRIDICAKPTGDFGNDPVSFFWQQDFNYTSCPQTFDNITSLRDPYLAINRKIMGLTGSPLNHRDFKQKNPMTKLDFSKAPHFDVIWVSSLNFSADFYGMVLSQALRYHGERGTQIRILVPAVTMTNKDKNILKRLQTDLPNIKIQYYRYNLSDENKGVWIDKFHRVNHTKLLIAHSAKNPQDSFLVTGGRNIRDSYLFMDRPLYRAYKFLKNYGDGEEPFIFYDDFEVEIRGASFVKSVMAQMLAFWMRDPQSQKYRSTNINIPKEMTPEDIQKLRQSSNAQPLIRHITSIPYSDGYQLEKFYIKMINSAKSELLLTTPYFRPSLDISAALDDAVERGVKIKIITRIKLAGDGTPEIAEDVNKQGINRHLANVDIYEWTMENSIMHAKILVIDKQLSFISSVNMNRRSFTHDTENGVLILNPKIAKDMRNVALSFINKGRKITSEEKIGWINSTLIDWADSFF